MNLIDRISFRIGANRDKWGILDKMHFRRIYSAIARNLQKDNNVKIVIINHFFDQDIHALQYAITDNAKVEFKILDPDLFYSWARYYFPLSVTALDGYCQTEHLPAQLVFRSRYTALFKELKKQFPRLVFLSPSDQFFWIREVVMACREVGIPFIVLDKEGTISPQYYDVHALEIGKYVPCISDHVLVWSERQKEFYKRAGYSNSKISVVGQPRSDFWFHRELWGNKGDIFNRIGLDASKKTILYFDFENNNYIHDSNFKKGFTWDVLLGEIHTSLFDIARLNGEINIVFKLHPQARNVQLVKDNVKRSGLNNVFVITGAEASNKLIVHSDLIVGGHSTAMLDAMLTSKPVIYTFWDNAPEFKENLIRFDENKGIDVATSQVHFRELVGKYVVNGFAERNDRQTQIERRKLTDVFFYAPDGKVGERVISKIVDLEKANEK